MTLDECKTVEEVEALQCYKCSKNHHYGWCDTSYILCRYKDKIKEILGTPDNKYTSEEHINMCLRGEQNEDSD